MEHISGIVDVVKEMYDEDPILVNDNIMDESGNEEKGNMLKLEKGIMKKNENDKPRVGIKKKNYAAYNRRVRQRRDEMAQSLTGSISKLCNAKAQKSLSLSQVEKENNEGVDMVLREPSTNSDNIASNQYKGKIAKINLVTEDANGEAGAEGYVQHKNGSFNIANEDYKEMNIDGKLRNESDNKEKKND